MTIPALQFVNNVILHALLVLALTPINAYYVLQLIKDRWLIHCAHVMMGSMIMELVYVPHAIQFAKNALIHRLIIARYV